jgi:hypothetical protein
VVVGAAPVPGAGAGTGVGLVSLPERRVTMGGQQMDR